jgi:hypothetical protein
MSERKFFISHKNFTRKKIPISFYSLFVEKTSQISKTLISFDVFKQQPEVKAVLMS